MNYSLKYAYDPACKVSYHEDYEQKKINHAGKQITYTERKITFHRMYEYDKGHEIYNIENEFLKKEFNCEINKFGFLEREEGFYKINTQLNEKERTVTDLKKSIGLWKSQPVIERLKLALTGLLCIAGSTALVALLVFTKGEILKNALGTGGERPNFREILIGFNLITRKGDKCGFEAFPAMVQGAFDVAYIGAILGGIGFGLYLIAKSVLLNSSKLEKRLTSHPS